MHYFEEKYFSVLKFPHWFKFVNYTFILVPSNTDFSSLLSMVNSIGFFIKCTFETENDISTSFLNVLVSKHIDWVFTTVFRKFLSISLSPHAPSDHPFLQKMSAFYTYINHALDVCSVSSNLPKELNS